MKLQINSEQIKPETAAKFLVDQTVFGQFCPDEYVGVVKGVRRLSQGDWEYCIFRVSGTCTDGEEERLIYCGWKSESQLCSSFEEFHQRYGFDPVPEDCTKEPQPALA